MRLFSWTNPGTFAGTRLIVARTLFEARDRIWWGRRLSGLEVREICLLEREDTVREVEEPEPCWHTWL